MKTVILTSSTGLCLMQADRADVVIPFVFRFVWGPLPSPGELAIYVATRSDKHGPGKHWSDYVVFPESREAGRSVSLGLADFCEQYDAIELWFDPNPNDQLLLVWLLDHLRAYPEIAPRLRLCMVHFDLSSADVDGFRSWSVHDVDVGEGAFETACSAWHAYRAPTPEACLHLLENDLSALPMLRPALLELLGELPSPKTGLGLTEMRFLEMLAGGYTNTNALFHLRSQRRTFVFGEFESGSLLEGLALGPKPAVAGLGDELRTIDRENLRGRHEIYLSSRLSLTGFGKALLAHQADFSRYNPIDRWWGGTHLTNDRLWRYGGVLTTP